MSKIEDGSPQVIERFIYGEGQPEELNLNLRGQVYQQYDSSGLVTNQQFDFKGNLLEVTRQLISDYKASVIDWSEGSPTNSLESQVFTVRTEYDALNRPTLLTSPDQSVTRPVYNEANLLEQVYVRLRGAAIETLFVENIDYDAKGQRTLIEYGNGVRTTYTYDPETFRLVRLLTIRTSDNARLQDLQYTYDPVGNITEIRDDAQQTVFFNNAVVSPNTRYEYDALYRLMGAEGREHGGQQGNSQPDHEDVPVMPLPHPNDTQAMRNYTERYEYDGVGNILVMIHAATNGNWTRRYQYAEDSNRLLATSRPGDGESEFSSTYTYDTHGNMTTMPHLPLMRWDYQDRLKATSRQVVNEGTPETTYYVYDSSGQRVRKVTERQAAAGDTSTRKNERIYLGGFEIYREYNGNGETVTLERETLHVMDDRQRIALVETKTIDTEDSSENPLLEPNIRYQLGNHLGSVSLEVDAAGAVISYEEYHPYGTTAYRSGRSAAEVSLKRYRYTGMERDEETGLGYHGARYYASWLGRWTATDPIGIGDGVNVYRYSRNNPVIFSDPAGTAPPQSQSDEFVPKPIEDMESRVIPSAESYSSENPYRISDLTPPEPISFNTERGLVTISSEELLKFKKDVYIHAVKRGERNTKKFKLGIQKKFIKRFKNSRAKGHSEVVEAGDKMVTELKEHLKAIGSEEEVSLTSTYRTADRQFNVWNSSFDKKLAKFLQNQDEVMMGVDLLKGYLDSKEGSSYAAPGYSRHQAAIATDFGAPTFKVKKAKGRLKVKLWKKTQTYKWLQENARDFGFVPLEKPDEPWHWNYDPKEAERQIKQIEMKKEVDRWLNDVKSDVNGKIDAAKTTWDALITKGGQLLKPVLDRI